MEDTSYLDKGKKKSQKGNAKRRMQRRNAANKGAKAQNEAGSPHADEEPPKTGEHDTRKVSIREIELLIHVVHSEALELAAKDAEVVSFDDVFPSLSI